MASGKHSELSNLIGNPGFDKNNVCLVLRLANRYKYVVLDGYWVNSKWEAEMLESCCITHSILPQLLSDDGTIRKDTFTGMAELFIDIWFLPQIICHLHYLMLTSSTGLCVALETVALQTNLTPAQAPIDCVADYGFAPYFALVLRFRDDQGLVFKMLDTVHGLARRTSQATKRELFANDKHRRRSQRSGV